MQSSNMPIIHGAPVAMQLDSKCTDPNLNNNFKDHFSNVAHIYGAARPTYPIEAFEWIKENAPGHSLAVDVGTGAGEAAIILSKFFDHVIATDASAKQVENAVGPENVTFKTAKAEECPVEDATADVITSAQAVHWFDHELFWKECDRILKPGGLTVLLSYHLIQFDDPALEVTIWNAAKRSFLDYRPPEIKHVLSRYQTLPGPFPGDEVWTGDLPNIPLKKNWNLDDVVRYFSSWSAIGAYKKANNDHDPIPDFRKDIETAWGDAETLRECKWDLTMRVFRKRFTV